MRVFKHQISTCKVLLCVSLLLNILFLGMVVVAERKGHVFSMILERKNIISLSDQTHPDYWARVGWTNTVKKLHLDFDIAFFGNSITRGSDFQQFFPDKKIINLGYSGDNLLGMLKRVPMIQAANPQKVFIMAGTNDLVHINLDEYKERYMNLITAIQDSIPGVQIYIQSVLPSNHEMAHYTSNNKVREANEIAKKLAVTYNCEYIDLYSLYVNEKNELPQKLTRDGVHLFPQCYDRWAEKIKPLIYK